MDTMEKHWFQLREHSSDSVRFVGGKKRGDLGDRIDCSDEENEQNKKKKQISGF
jgi:hypothetical protein